MANSVSIDGYLHVEGFDQFDQEAFNKRKIRAGMRKVGQLIAGRAQMNLALGGGQEGYPVNRTGATTESINFKLSRSGFLVRVAPNKTASMKEYYPAYLHYGVRRKTGGGWRISPRDNYMTDALTDSRAEVQRILQQAFAAALLN
ncbi:hypothetical protein [Pseudomonas soli]|uniref:Phage protein, HK97 gp10 family n=1 Tax=Pseudomonas soli TaxID=1306993 RepID=A0A2V4ISQ1_9PSED|nr:hypothetical protein [Pseudomonas soli]PYB84137.1 hypothetical protein DMX07_06220 [Pseudomonas soli]